jgi:2-succinyl-5-enolpyruvyl-6-hydroxy-3-cyclohexene-1-carboxylate synthase
MSDDERMNPSTALATAIVNALAELGVRHVVLCPGSRSAPLAYAVAEAAGQAAVEVTNTALDKVADAALGKVASAAFGEGASAGFGEQAGGAGGGPRIRLHVRLDERAAGFLALGLAIAGQADSAGQSGTGGPAVVITTSGTAVANLHPAVLEAAHSGVPLLVISADRPHELRGTGASQTTDQVKLFGDAVRWFAEIPAPTQVRVGLVPVWRNVVARAVAAARGNPGGNPGPVQLNVAFADPLTPDRVPPGEHRLAGRRRQPPADDWPEPLTGPAGTAGLTVLGPTPPPVAVTLPIGPRTVVLAGHGAGPAAAELAGSAGWPLLAEPSSGARTAAAIGPYRLLLGRPELGGRIERVVMYGRPTLSRPVTRLLARADVELIVVSSRPDWPDAGRRAALVTAAVRIDPTVGAESGADVELGDSTESVVAAKAADLDWLRTWSEAGSAAATAIDELLDAEAAAGRLTGPLIARETAAATGAGDILFVGSSNPIRDLDLAGGPVHPTAQVLANRGLAGIDGTLSSASGVALAARAARNVRDSHSGGQVRCLVGDLTFLHDAGGLLVGPLEQRPDLQIVVLDDGGGGIFELLEHGELASADAATATNPDPAADSDVDAVADQTRRAVFERIFGTPQNADLAALCAGYRVRHELVDDVERLRKALSDPPPGTSVIQVRVDRSAHRALSARLQSAVAQTFS